MATAPENALPLFYKDLVPLQSNVHADWKARRMPAMEFLRGVHAVPATVDEFVPLQRDYPIVFSLGDAPVPLLLFGLNEGVNLSLNEEGLLPPDLYVPAYVRRYPFMLARLQPDSEELSLCFDPTPEALGPFEDGEALFVDGQPADALKQTLDFCEQFELAGQRTNQFMAELKAFELLMDAEVTMEVPGVAQPFIYRGFQIVNEEKLRNMRGDQLRKMQQSGLLPLVHAHIFSLQLMPVLFQRQYEAGLAPTPQAQ